MAGAVTTGVADELRAWLAAVVAPLVDEPDAVSVHTEDLAGGVLLAVITVAEGDVGRVVGARGGIVLSVQALARAFGFRRGLEIVVALPQSRLGRRRVGS